MVELRLCWNFGAISPKTLWDKTGGSLGNMENVQPLVPTVKGFRLAYCLAAFVAFGGGVTIYVLFRNIDDMVMFRY